MTRPVAALLIALFGVNLWIGPWYQKNFKPPNYASTNEVLLDLVGEARLILARYLWFRMDLFHEVLDDQGVRNEEQSELIPLMRMVSLLDPSFTDSFDGLAWDLWKGHYQPRAAIDLVDEGLRHNPKDFRLNFRKAQILVELEDYKTARQHADIALQNTNDEFELMDALRVLRDIFRKTGDKKSEAAVLRDLLQFRPGEPRWTQDLKDLESSLVGTNP